MRSQGFSQRLLPEVAYRCSCSPLTSTMIKAHSRAGTKPDTMHDACLQPQVLAEGVGMRFTNYIETMHRGSFLGISADRTFHLKLPSTAETCPSAHRSANRHPPKFFHHTQSLPNPSLNTSVPCLLDACSASPSTQWDPNFHPNPSTEKVMAKVTAARRCLCKEQILWYSKSCLEQASFS